MSVTDALNICFSTWRPMQCGIVSGLYFFLDNVSSIMWLTLCYTIWKKKHDWIKTFRGQCGQHWTKPGNPRKTFEIFGIQFFNHFEGELSTLICSFGQYHTLNPLWSFLIFFLFFSDLYWQTGRRVYFAVYSE